jgi:hypothetical protein
MEPNAQERDADQAVVAAGKAAVVAASLRHFSAASLDELLRAITARLADRAGAVLAANAGLSAKLADACTDSLSLNAARIRAMSDQPLVLAQVPRWPQRRSSRNVANTGQPDAVTGVWPFTDGRQPEMSIGPGANTSCRAAKSRNWSGSAFCRNPYRLPDGTCTCEGSAARAVINGVGGLSAR